jgi:hypothetical protein
MLSRGPPLSGSRLISYPYSPNGLELEFPEIQPPSKRKCPQAPFVPQCVAIILGASGLQDGSATPFHIPRTGALFTQECVEQEFSEDRQDIFVSSSFG